jgi:hypothetical protein
MDNYNVITKTTLNELCITVSEKMNNGWLPIGGITVIPANGPFNPQEFAQAMMKIK